MKKQTKLKAILVTTQHRGVFAGLVPSSQDMTARTMALKQARCAIYWATQRGIAELADEGPNDKSKIGAPADIEALHDITAVWAISPGAWEKWQSAK